MTTAARAAIHHFGNRGLATSPPAAGLFDDPIMRDYGADHGEFLHWQFAHCDDSNVNLPSL